MGQACWEGLTTVPQHHAHCVGVKRTRQLIFACTLFNSVVFVYSASAIKRTYPADFFKTSNSGFGFAHVFLLLPLNAFAPGDERDVNSSGATNITRTPLQGLKIITIRLRQNSNSKA